MSFHSGNGYTTTPTNTSWETGINSENVIWTGVPNAPSGGCYVSALHFYAGGGYYDGAFTNSINSQLALLQYNGSINNVLVSSGTFSMAYGTAWYTAGITAYYLAGNAGSLSIAWYSDPAQHRQWKVNNVSSSIFYWEAYTGSFPSLTSTPFGNTQSGQQIACYYDYYDPLTISGVSQTPVGIGQTFTVTGSSLSASISSIVINGVAGNVNVTSYTVDSDSQITCTVPSGASTGTVTVNSAVGSATSTQQVLVSGGFYKTGGVVDSTKGTYFKVGGTVYPTKGAWYKTGGVIYPVK